MLEGAVAALRDDPAVDVLLIHVGLAPGVEDRIAREITNALSGTTKPAAVCWVPDHDAGWHRRLSDAGIPVLDDPVKLVTVASAAVHFANAVRTHNKRESQPASCPTPPPAAPASGAGSVIAEAAAKSLLRQWGIRVPNAELVTSRDDAEEAANRIGYPVVAKLIAPEIAHRGRIGAVRTHLDSSGQVRDAFDDVIAAAHEHLPDITAEGVLVEEMVAGGFELYVSATFDPSFGAAISCGLGGVHVETLGRTSTELAPLDAAGARRLLASAGLTDDTTDKFDVASAVDALTTLSRVILALPGVETIEINPLTVLSPGLGAIALDALVVLEQGQTAKEDPACH